MKDVIIRDEINELRLITSVKKSLLNCFNVLSLLSNNLVPVTETHIVLHKPKKNGLKMVPLKANLSYFLTNFRCYILSLCFLLQYMVVLTPGIYICLKRAERKKAIVQPQYLPCNAAITSLQGSNRILINNV